MGKKYIIELEDPQIGRCSGEKVWWVKGCRIAMIFESDLEKLTPYEEPEAQVVVPFSFSDRLNEALNRFWEGSNRSFAEACHISEVSMSRYLSGDRSPKAAAIARMARVLNVSTDYLLGLEDR